MINWAHCFRACSKATYHGRIIKNNKTAHFMSRSEKERERHWVLRLLIEGMSPVT
jgi:hypothetical protein